MLTKKETLKNDLKGSKTTKTDPFHSNTEHSSGCCEPVSKAANDTFTKSYSNQQTHPSHQETLSPYDKKTHNKTRITIKYDVGYNNQLYIRGKGANLSWDKGHPLKNIKHDEWVWETEANFTTLEFKVLINDRVYENGNNHFVHSGSSLLYTPHFH